MNFKICISLVQNKIAEFFENSAMDDRFLKFDAIQNEIEILRMNLYSVKESSKLNIEFNISNPNK